MRPIFAALFAASSMSACIATRAPPVIHPDSCGSHVECYNQALIALKEAEALVGSQEVQIPQGTVLLWDSRIKDASGKTVGYHSIPTGWMLCDGTNNTIDLRGRFIKGTESPEQVGATGGTATIPLDEGKVSTNESNQLYINVNDTPDGTHTVQTIPKQQIKITKLHDHGGNNLPPFATLQFICRTAEPTTSPR